MKKLISIGAIAVSVSLAGAAHAATVYASNPLYAGQTGNDVITCRFFNPNSTSIQFTDIAVINNIGNRLNITANNCGGPIASLNSCSFSATSPGNQSFVCYGVITGTKPDMTGIAEIKVGSSYLTQAIIRQP